MSPTRAVLLSAVVFIASLGGRASAQVTSPGLEILRPAGLFNDVAPAERAPSFEYATSLAGPSAGVEAMASPAPLAPLSAGLLGQAGTPFRSWYLEGKIGPLLFLRHYSDVNPGWQAEGALGFHLIRFLAIEAFSGYFTGDDSNTTVYGIPIGANIKLTIPVFVVEPYAGIGGAGFYIHTDENFLPDTNEWVGGGDAFVGLNVTLGPLLLGLEGKYMLTDKVKTTRGQVNIDTVSLMACLGIRW